MESQRWDDDDDGPECDHDDEIMCHHVFFDQTTTAHLDRRRFRAMLEARRHWVIAVTPDCVFYALRLEMLHRQRCGVNMLTLCIHDLRINPLMCLLPRGQFSLDDILHVMGGIGTSREVIESKKWILLTSGDVDAYQEAINLWINVDAVLN
jgi:hypothetical protein